MYKSLCRNWVWFPLWPKPDFQWAVLTGCWLRNKNLKHSEILSTCNLKMTVLPLLCGYSKLSWKCLIIAASLDTEKAIHLFSFHKKWRNLQEWVLFLELMGTIVTGTVSICSAHCRPRTWWIGLIDVDWKHWGERKKPDWSSCYDVEYFEHPHCWVSCSHSC